MPRLKKTQTQVFSSQAATGTSNVVPVENYRHIVVGISAVANATLTFKFKGSVLNNDESDLTAAQSTTNIWDYIEAFDLEDAVAIAGDTGVSLDNDTAANNTRQYIINSDWLSQFAVEVTAYTDGSLEAWVVAAND